MLIKHLFTTLLFITILTISCSITGDVESGKHVYSLYVSSDSTGSVVDTGSHQITETGEYELIADQPDIGYKFSYWKVDSGEGNIKISNKDSVKTKVTSVKGNAVIRAVFTKEQLSIKVVAMPVFAVDSVLLTSDIDNNGKYDYGTNVTIKIRPKSGWEITGWERLSTGASDSVNIIIKNDISDTVFLSPIKVPANVICVKFDAPQNGGGAMGSSWVDAYTDLNTALNAVTATRNLIWVAKGTYTPVDINTPFTLHANSSVIGGFAGTETAATSRDSIHNTTILSGKINSTNNARAIVNVPTGADNVYLSTFIIEGAVGNSTAPYGGVYATMSNNLTIFRCVVQGNSPRAVETGYKSKILQCAIVNNSGEVGVGVRVQKDSSFIINTIISNNNATTSGSGVQVVTGTRAFIINCTVFGNKTSNSGGENTAGIYRASSNAKILMSNCILWGNTVDGTAHTRGTQINFTDTVYYSNIQDTANGTGIGLKYSGWWASGILSIGPLFVDYSNPKGADGLFFTDDDGLMLSTGSQSENAGGTVVYHDEWVPTVDIRGKSRLNNRIDMGAYER